MMQIEYKNVKELKKYFRNPRKNEKAVAPVAKSIEKFGFKDPIVIDKNNVIICGHTRYMAALKLGLTEVPTVCADDLSPEQVQAFRLADNKIGELAAWDLPLLDEAIADIGDTINMEEFGFDLTDYEDDEDDDEDFGEDDDGGGGAEDKKKKPEYECPECGYKFSE